MKQIAFEQRKLMANFFANIGVAWFAAGVIGIFVNRMTNYEDVFISLIWGLGFSALFLINGAVIIKGIDKKRK